MLRFYPMSSCPVKSDRLLATVRIWSPFQDSQKRLRQSEYEPSIQDGLDNKLPRWTARVALNE